jgi:hypothetical protein
MSVDVCNVSGSAANKTNTCTPVANLQFTAMAEP